MSLFRLLKKFIDESLGEPVKIMYALSLVSNQYTTWKYIGKSTFLCGISQPASWESDLQQFSSKAQRLVFYFGSVAPFKSK